jgi:hypothetical protein
LFEGFLAELKRRHVIRVAGVYTVAAWGVFQVVHTILETVGLALRGSGPPSAKGGTGR